MTYTDFSSGRFYNGDCLEVMKEIPDGVIDMILCDLPYGTTACKWDAVIPFAPLWAEYNRICKSKASMIFTASQPFTSALLMSNPKSFKVEWIWEKSRGSNFATTKYMPMKEHENILVFNRERGIYNQIKETRTGRGLGMIGMDIAPSNTGKRDVYSNIQGKHSKVLEDQRCPRSIQKFNNQTGLHPTQKPVALFEYLIKTYSNSDMLILDNTAGSGTTAIAAINTGRKWVCIEQDPDYYAKACERISAHNMPSVTIDENVPKAAE